VSVAVVPRGSAVPPVATTALLLAAALLFATATDLPGLVGLSIVGVGVAAGTGMRFRRAGPLGAVAVVPVLGALAILAATAPSTPVADLFGGASALACLLWLAGGPGSSEGALGRVVPTIALLGLVLLIAWAGLLLLPHAPALFGVGGLLLVAVTILVAFLIGRPDLIDWEPPAID
jgi:hypothetical protein